MACMRLLRCFVLKQCDVNKTFEKPRMKLCMSRNTGLYSHLFNKRGGWNKGGGGAKVAKSLNVEVGINVEGGIFWKKLVQLMQ